MIKRIIKSIVVFILTFEAWLVLKKYKPKIIAVTGSVGKTTTKDAIADVLEKKYYIGKSAKSFNSEFGVPLTILRCESGWGSATAWIRIILEGVLLIVLKNHYPKILVLEVGTDRPGDIPKITQWLKPDVAMITRFGEVPVHVEFFSSREALIEEKSTLVEALKKEGTAVLNIDDKDIKKLAHHLTERSIITFGFAEDAMVRALNPEVFYDNNGMPQGISCRIEYGDKVLPLRIHGSISVASIYAALGGFAIGVSEEMNMVDMLETLGGREQPAGRSKLLSGIHGSVLIDDTYNSSPTALAAALSSLEEIEVTGRKIAVLGDMLELGKHTAEEHQKMGALAKGSADVLVTVGPRSLLASEEAHKKRMPKKDIHHFSDSREAGEFLKDFIHKGDVVLFKASQSIRMERAILSVLNEKDRAHELLVRQEREWQER